MSEFSREMIVEALLFASTEPVALRRLAEAAGLAEPEVEQAIGLLNAAYEREDRAFRVQPIAEGWQLRTLPELAGYVRGLGRQLAAGRLSAAALETLAIIAYRQPIGRAEIEKIRGVGVSGVVKSLMEKKLVTVTGRAQVLGRPLLYGTTRDFLRHFGLAELGDLPRESELQVLLGQERTRRSPGTDGNGAGETASEDEEQQNLM